MDPKLIKNFVQWERCFQNSPDYWLLFLCSRSHFLINELFQCILALLFKSFQLKFIVPLLSVPTHFIKHHKLHFKSNICVKHSTCLYLVVNGNFPNCSLDHCTNHLVDFSGLHFLCQDSQCFENFSRIQGSSRAPAQYCLAKKTIATA